MLRVLREHATSWMLRGILILVAVTFISWGGYSLIRDDKETYIAKVGDTTIETKDYYEAYQGVVKQYRDALGPAFTDKMIEELRLKERVLDDLIARVLILQEAQRVGLSVGDEELRRSIESIPAFQFNGQFDQRTYERFLRINRIGTETFERMQREGLLFSKMVNLIKSNGGKVVEEEVLETYLFENEKVNLHFLKISPEAFRREIAVNEVEVKDSYQKQPEEFRTPVFTQIQYLVFRPSDVEGRVQVSPEEVKRNYDSQKDRFKTPKQVRAREILIKVNPQDPSEKVEEKKKKAEEILEKAKKTKDFGSLAKQYSESASAPRGGEVGWVQQGMLDEQVDTILFALKAGEVSPVLKGSAGFTLFKVEEVKEERQITFEEVKDQILQTLKKEKAKGEASRRADDAFYSLFRSRDLEGYAKEKGIPIRTTGFFKEGDDLPEIGRDPSFYSSAFSLKTGEISPVVSIPPNFYLLKCIEKKDSRIPPLEEVREEVKGKVAETKADEKARQVAEEILTRIKEGKSLKEIGQERGWKVEETGLFPRTGAAIPKVGPAGEFMGQLSSLTLKNPVPKEVLRTQEGYFVLRLLGVEPADQGKFASVKKNLEKRLIYQKQEEFYQAWLDQLRKQATIKINKEML